MQSAKCIIDFIFSFCINIRIKKVLCAISKELGLISPQEYEGDYKRNSDDKEEPLLEGC